MMLRIWRLPAAERAARDLSSLRVVLHLGAPCPVWLKEAWIEWLGPDVICEVYAEAEALGATMITGREWLVHRGSVGRPLYGEFRVVDPAGREHPRREVGEIVMRRRPNDPPPCRYVGAEARTFGDGWESLGDLGWMDADGYLYLADRRTDLILVGGANVYPAEVEAALEEHPRVRSSAVVGLPDEDLGQRVHAIVQVEGEVSDDELRAHLAERLVRYKIPRTFERSPTPLRDDAGKVRRSELAARRRARPATPEPARGPVRIVIPLSWKRHLRGGCGCLDVARFHRRFHHDEYGARAPSLRGGGAQHADVVEVRLGNPPTQPGCSQN
jgi:bile acid-coenzyme A ligase